MAGDKESGHPTTSDALRTTARSEGMVELAGYRLSATMLDELEAATPASPAPLRTVAPGDIGGSALWLRAEPGEDAAMVSGMANDIVRWLDDVALVITPPPSPAPLPVAVADTLVEDAMGLLHARRQQFSFDIGDLSCAVTVDRGRAFKAGLLILSGGNEIRSGAHRGMAELADRLAQAGHSVLRFDRRGVGDSEGDNRGFEHSAEELAAALQLFRTVCGGMSRIVAFGNCDAAAALLLHHSAAELDRLVLANVWTIETFEAEERDAPAQAAALPPAAAIRARYAQKLRDPREWLRLVRGGVDLQKLWRGLRASRSRPPSGLADRLGACLAASNVPATILIAENDGTALAFMEQWRGSAFAAARAADTARILAHPTGSHGFADDDAREWLFARLLEALGAETD
jgi:exosortase A-associated hydrolase 1